VDTKQLIHQLREALNFALSAPRFNEIVLSVNVPEVKQSIQKRSDNSASGVLAGHLIRC